MPTYEYKCNTCGHHFERVQRFADAPITECPECGAPVRRVIHPAGVIFKGAGWYITDSRKGGGDSASISPANGAKAESGDTAAKSDGDAAKSESKPAEKSTAATES
jgi:putative FmdB family regulatory protein